MNPEKGFNRASGGDTAFSYSSIAKARNCDAHMGLYDGENNPFYGQHHSEETKKHLSKLRSKPVKQYDIDGNLIAWYPSQLAAAAAFGVSVQSINSNCKGKTKTCAGFVFRYAEAL